MKYLTECLCCDKCGREVAWGNGDFNCTDIICVECVEKYYTDTTRSFMGGELETKVLK